MAKLDEQHRDSMLPQQTTILDVLPFEVLSAIFSHLEQSDILRCMAVSRLWRTRIPMYSVERWTSVKIYSKRGGLANRRLAACLGPHVRRVSLSGYKSVQELELTLRVLIDLECLYIESLEFYNTLADFTLSFYHLLRQVSVSLRSISFLRHSGIFDFFDVMPVCPELTSFDCSLTESGELWAHRMPVRTEITHLCLSSHGVGIDPQLELILFQCPKLKFLATNNPWMRSPGKLDRLIQLCPSIQYFEYDFMSTRKARHYRNKHFHDDEHSNGLRELVVSGFRMTQDMTTVFQFLERLQMATCLLTQASFPPTLRLDRLRVLVCKLVGCDETFNLGMLLRQCPNVEELTTNSFPLNIDMCQALREMPCLRKLVLKHNMMLRPEDDLVLVDLFQVISQLPFLEHLHISNLLTSRTTYNLADMTSLKRLEIEITKTEAITQLAAALSVDENPPSRIHTLALSNIGNLNDLLVLDKLAAIESLEHLILAGSSLDGPALRTLVKVAPHLRTVTIKQCYISEKRQTLKYVARALDYRSFYYTPIPRIFTDLERVRSLPSGSE